MKTIDNTVLAGYNAGIERDRLRTGIGLIEFERTKEILLEKLPKPPAVIYDIGGAYGEYSWWLASLGYEVYLFDLSETNIAMSAELATDYPGVKLVSATVCDARSIPRLDKSADAVLLMGPLYSITEYEERILAIEECGRLLKDDGILFSAALTPYSVLVPRIALYHIDGTAKRRELDDPAVISMIERALEDGCYCNPEKKIASGLGSSHLHTAKALREELSEGGFDTASVAAARLECDRPFCSPGDAALLQKSASQISSIPLHHLHPNSRISRQRIHIFPVLKGRQIRLFCCHRKWYAQ